NDTFQRFKDLADRKAEIFDEDIHALVSGDGVGGESEHYRYVSLVQHSETGERPKARVVFSIDGREVISESQGNGPVDAT
ncbi:alpha-isopropylmalate synthase regulatory domain-containing protein, partial [Vibrio vulnificus]|uniref:alpha-isopropylmalate synthase regulatory domain-containing protein n=2 Tax=Pseudomonadota TaxID=1224 RepID=UPI0039B59E37